MKSIRSSQPMKMTWASASTRVNHPMRLWMKVNSFHVMVAETEGNEVTPRIPAITRANTPKAIRVIESE